MAAPPQGTPPGQIAERFLQAMREGRADDKWTEDVLVFFTRLKDQFEVAGSKSVYVSPRGWGVLEDLIQQLEEQGSSLLSDQDVVERLSGLLTDLSTGKISFKRRTA